MWVDQVPNSISEGGPLKRRSDTWAGVMIRCTPSATRCDECRDLLRLASVWKLHAPNYQMPGQAPYSSALRKSSRISCVSDPKSWAN